MPSFTEKHREIKKTCNSDIYPDISADMEICKSSMNNKNEHHFDIMKKEQKARIEAKPFDKMYENWDSEQEIMRQRRKLLKSLRPGDTEE